MRLIHILASNRWSGVERYALDLCRHFRDRGWKVTALTRDAKAVDNKFADVRIDLAHAPLAGFFDVPTVASLVRMLRRGGEEPTVIHVHRYRDALRAIMARKASRRRDVKVVMTLHNVMAGRDTAIYRYIYRHLDAHIFVSNTVRERFLSTWKGRPLPFSDSSQETIYNSLYMPRKETPDEPSKGPVVAMYHGRLAPGKGLETLLKALSLIARRTLRLRIVGSGNPDYVDSLRLLAQSLGVMDIIDWRKHVDDVLPLIAEAHFGILPSEEPEAFGLSNLEYMALGRPVISTLNGGQAEYLTDAHDSFLVEAGDAEALAEAMRTLARDPERRREMGQAACETWRTRLSWEDFVSRIEKIYSAK